ncbi:hypothetical protein [Longimicrobium terrae]|uniref:DUF5667 domain-containing protein n=1 Tax=Longimicrobium terrae TaxID=1639882 RepID=A0A841H287_9BACT|nr:hypothetical protein [Longimicrobium terrae]MBB4637592.1 hypothetical protein [Longimicrobium terrae]MBB6071989.1 hypothetical protein [Longimicrobium terrae]NNC29923.1 hypothetical protein [Longimicrobium terrae]
MDTEAAAGPRWNDGLRDPWVLGGLALLAVLSCLAVVLYAGQPQTAAEVGGRAWVAIAPDAYTPRISRARERVSAAISAAAAGDTAAALARYAEAEEQALDARQNAGQDSVRLVESTEMWAGIALDRAGMMLASGASPWYRADDKQRLNDALAVAQRVRAAPVAASTRTRADALIARIQRQLRPGPLEWIPR